MKFANSRDRYLSVIVPIVALLLSFHSRHVRADRQYLDVNNITAGSGVTSGGAYSWENAIWTPDSTATDPGGTAATTNWIDGEFASFTVGATAGGTTGDAGTNNYTVTANANHVVNGMMERTGGGGTVTLNGTGVLSFSGDQGFFVQSPSATSNLKILSVLGGTGRVAWQSSTSGGSLYLYGNNTFTGGVLINTSQGLNINNANSFGSAGTITLTGSATKQSVIAVPTGGTGDATAAFTISNPVATSSGGGGSLIFVSSTAAPVTFSGQWTLSTGTSSIQTNTTNSTLTISGAVVGTDATSALTKLGTPTLALTGTNTYQGPTTISAGTLQLGNGGATGSLSTSSTITDNATLTFNRSAAFVQGTDFSGSPITGTGAVSLAASTTLTLNAANSYSGNTTINTSSLLKIANASATGTGTLVVGGNGSFDNTSGGALTMTNNMNQSGGSPTFVGSNDLTIGNIALSVANRTMTVTAKTLTVGNVTQDASARNYTKSGAGTLVINGAGSYTGTTTISAGTLQLGNGGTTGSLSTSSAITDNSNLTIKRSNTVTQGTDFSGSAVTGSGSLTQAGSGALILTASNSYSGATTISAGTLQLGNSGATGSLSTSSAITDNGNLSFKRTNTVTQGTDFSGSAIAGSGSLTQGGSGTVILNANNSYSGGTTINAGTLKANNTPGGSSSATGSGAVVVNSGGTLAGTGAVSGAVTVNTGGKLSPGDANTESLAVGALSLMAGSTFVYEVDSRLSFATGADLVNVAALGNTVITTTGTGVTLSVSDLNPTPVLYANKFTLLSYDATKAPIGTFAGRPEGSLVTIGVTNYTIHYADVSPGVNFDAPIAGSGFNYVTLVAVPEARAFLLVGLVCVVFGAAKSGRKLFAGRDAPGSADDV